MRDRFATGRLLAVRLFFRASGLLLPTAALYPGAVHAASDYPEPLKTSVCRQHVALFPGDKFGLLSLPAPGRWNGSGVLILVNCSSRAVVSLRDPSHSPRHLREFVYDPDGRARLPHDPNIYGVLNFNEPVHNTSFDHTIYAKSLGWTGPCTFDGLELITVDPRNAKDRQTMIFSLNICANLVLALVEPPGSVAPAAKK